ncbi:MAG: type IV pilus assembly protein PilM [Pseudomonadales bacterium]
MVGIFNKNKPQAVLGIDISSSAVKLVELSKHGKGYKVEHMAVVPMPPNVVVEKAIRDEAAVGETIARAVEKSGTKLKYAAVAVAGSAVITKIIEMEGGLADEQLEALISVEADQYIPYPIEEVAMDFTVIGPSESHPDMDQVLLAACRNENVESRVDALDVADIVAKVVDVEAYALQRAVSLLEQQLGLDSSQVVAVFDIGASMTTLTVFHEGEAKYTREQLFGGKQLIEEIQHRYGLSAQESMMAVNQGGLPEGYEDEVLAPFVDSVSQQITRALQFFFSSTSYNDVDYIFLAGGVATADGLEERVRDSSGVDVSIANPLKEMGVASKVDAGALAQYGPALLVACGLAMRSFG